MNVTKLLPVKPVSVPLLCLALSACGGGSGSNGGATSTQDLVAACSGSYVCSYDGQSFTSSMQRQDGTCYLGQIEMDPGGQAVDTDGTALGWGGDSKKFVLCASDGCLQCTSQSTGGSSPAPTHQKSCQGTTEGCPLSPPCYVVQGCDLEIGYDAFGNPDDSCSGYPDPCDSFSDQDSCEAQGCTWQ